MHVWRPGAELLLSSCRGQSKASLCHVCFSIDQSWCLVSSLDHKFLQILKIFWRHPPATQTVSLCSLSVSFDLCELPAKTMMFHVASKEAEITKKFTWKRLFPFSEGYYADDGGEEDPTCRHSEAESKLRFIVSIKSGSLCSLRQRQTRLKVAKLRIQTN